MMYLTLLLLSACDPAVQSYSEEGKIYQGETPDERRSNALNGISSEKISFEASEVLEDMLGDSPDALASDAPTKLKGIDAKYTVSDLLADEVVRVALNGTDEAAAAKLVRDAGIKVFILHSDAAASFDRNNQVLNRLYRHDHLEYFQLLRVGDGLLYYTIRPSPAMFPPKLAYAAIEYLKHRMSGERIAPFPDVESPDGVWTLAAVLRDQGEELSVAFARDAKLQGVLEELVDDLIHSGSEKTPSWRTTASHGEAVTYGYSPRASPRPLRRSHSTSTPNLNPCIDARVPGSHAGRRTQSRSPHRCAHAWLPCRPPDCG